MTFGKCLRLQYTCTQNENRYMYMYTDCIQLVYMYHTYEPHIVHMYYLFQYSVQVVVVLCVLFVSSTVS